VAVNKTRLKENHKCSCHKIYVQEEECQKNENEREKMLKIFYRGLTILLKNFLFIGEQHLKVDKVYLKKRNKLDEINDEH
jgi:hypothetical protein